MPDFGGLINKVKDLAGKHPDQVHDGVDKAEDVVKEKLGGKYDDQVEQGGDKVEGFLGADQAGQADQVGQADQTGQAGETDEQR